MYSGIVWFLFQISHRMNEIHFNTIYTQDTKDYSAFILLKATKNDRCSKHFQFKLWQTSNLLSLRRLRIRENIFNIFNRLNFWIFALWIHAPYWYDIVWWRKIKCYHGRTKRNTNFIVKNYSSSAIWM